MKILRWITLVLFFSVFACANDLDVKILKNIYENVILKESSNALNSINTLEKSVNTKDEKEIKESFKRLVISWKSVEALYILGDLDEDFIDTPRLMDIFHNGNEDIKKQLDFAFKSGEDAKVALFKNSLKSINALEYIIYTKDLKDEKVQKFLYTIINRVKIHLEDIYEAYTNNEEAFLNNIKKSNSIIINSLIQNSYKLKEWRIADVVGITKKYDKADNRRSEYYLSKNSSVAIKAILNTYKSVLDNPEIEDYGDYLIKLTDGKRVKELRESLNKAILLVENIKNDNLENQKELYNLTNNIHIILFVDMIEDLQINAKILDADGD